MADRAPHALAYARLLGYMSTDGSFGADFQLYMGHSLDAEQVLVDLHLLTGIQPAVSVDQRILHIIVPRVLRRAIAGLGVTLGKRTGVVTHFPAFLLEPDCPLPVVREFVAGLFGGDGITVNVSHRPKGQMVLQGLGFCTTRVAAVAEEQMEVLERELFCLLERLGIDCTKITTAFTKVAPNTLTEKGRAEYRELQSQGVVIAPRGTAGKLVAGKSYVLKFEFSHDLVLPFANRVGFRYCCHKQQRLSAALAYCRMIELFREQRRKLCTRIIELRKPVEGKSSMVARDANLTFAVVAAQAKQELTQREQLLPEIVAWKPVTASQLHTNERTLPGGTSVAKQLHGFDCVRFFSTPRKKTPYSAAAQQRRLSATDESDDEPTEDNAETTADAETTDNTADEAASPASPPRTPRRRSAPLPSSRRRSRRSRKSSAWLNRIIVLPSGREVPDSDVLCVRCGLDDNDDDGVLLLCDGCDSAYHIRCHRPPLFAVPDDDWYCSNCRVKHSFTASLEAALSAAATSAPVPPLAGAGGTVLPDDDRDVAMREQRSSSEARRQPALQQHESDDMQISISQDRRPQFIPASSRFSNESIRRAVMHDRQQRARIAAMGDAIAAKAAFYMTDIVADVRRMQSAIRELDERPLRMDLARRSEWELPAPLVRALQAGQLPVRRPVEEDEYVLLLSEEEKSEEEAQEEEEEEQEAAEDDEEEKVATSSMLSDDSIESSSNREQAMDEDVGENEYNEDSQGGDNDGDQDDQDIQGDDEEEDDDDEEEDGDDESNSPDKVTYGVHSDARVLPLFRVRLVGRRDVGVKRVYDLSVPCSGSQGDDNSSFMANGVVVHNCDESFDFTAMGRIFVGLCQCGAWGCFDEFNRLEERILSAVSQQILTIQHGLINDQTSITLLSKSVKLDPRVGLFVTMNPGYAGRSNLPDNLKQLFRPIAMISPDKSLIAQVMLYSQGFRTAEQLSVRVVELFTGCSERLSKKSHYDFGLRALKSVLRSAGGLKRAELMGETGMKGGDGVAGGKGFEEEKVRDQEEKMKESEDHEEKRPTKPTTSAASAVNNMSSADKEQSLLVRSITSTIVPKLVSGDVNIFSSIISNVFPTASVGSANLPALRAAIAAICADQGFVDSPLFVDKLMQLYDISALHHGVIMVGPEGTGKSVAWNVLRQAVERVSGQKVSVYVIDPKAISKVELFGTLDDVTMEYTDGVFTHLLRRIIDNVRGEMQRQHWIVFDGDVDPDWAENLNSVLDDNKLLTLPNGERLALTQNVRLMFEVGSLDFATPATVSRCGMVWFSEEVVHVSDVMRGLLTRLKSESMSHANLKPSVYARWRHVQERSADIIAQLTGFTAISRTPTDTPTAVSADDSANFLLAALDWSTRQPHIMPLSPHRALMSLFSLFKGAIAKVIDYDDNHADFPLSDKQLEAYLSRYLVFAVLWSFGGSLSLRDRLRFCDELISICPPSLPLPEQMKGALLDWEVRVDSQQWEMWEDRVDSIELDAHKVVRADVVIDTVDTARHTDVISQWVADHRPLLLCGPPGSGNHITQPSLRHNAIMHTSRLLGTHYSFVLSMMFSCSVLQVSR